MLRRIALFLFFVFLSGCGFRLRGIYEIPTWFNNVAIVNQGVHRDLALMLKDQLQAYKICIVADNKNAQYLLILQKDDMQEQITTISASTNPRQYELTYTIHYALLKNHGQNLIPSGVVTVSRQLTVNNDRILGSNAEEAMLYSEMRRDAALQIINRINRKLN